MDTTIIEKLLYDNTSDKKIINWINTNSDPMALYVLAYNFNWDGGFEVPICIFNSPNCSLSTALLLFYRAEGELFLQNKQSDNSDTEWFNFISELYKKILNNDFSNSYIHFKCPLTKVLVYKLSKIISEEENVFITEIPGDNLDITV
jgi:hypothetical protein